MFENMLKITGKIKNDVKLKPAKQVEGNESDEIVEEKVFVTVNTRIDNINQTKSLVYVELSKELWDEIKDFYETNSVTIIGEMQARITKNNKPFIYMIAREVYPTKAYNQEQKKLKSYQKHLKDIENDKLKGKELRKAKNQKNNEKEFLSWRHHFKEEEFQEMDISKIFIKEEQHMKGVVNFYIKTKTGKDAKISPLVVRAEENGMYSLVTGFGSYARSKMLNRNPSVHITELTLNEFKDKYTTKQQD